MNIEQKVKQHKELIAELIKSHEESRKRIKLMENIQAVFIPVMTVIGVGSVISFIYIFLKVL